MFVQPLELTGKSTADKRREAADWLAAIGADACVLVALDSIAWLFNVRGSDIAVVPVNFAYASRHFASVVNSETRRYRPRRAIFGHRHQDTAPATEKTGLRASSNAKPPISVAIAARSRRDRRPLESVRVRKCPGTVDLMRNASAACRHCVKS